MPLVLLLLAPLLLYCSYRVVTTVFLFLLVSHSPPLMELVCRGAGIQEEKTNFAATEI